MTAFDAVLYVKNLGYVAEFYRRVLESTPVAVSESIVEVRFGASRLVLHAIPAHIAETFAIAVPPVRREESAIKLSFEVASLSRARAAAAEVGGSVDAVQREWQADGRRYVDGADPEGNVVQFYTSVRER
jgi:hypothetical protein